MQVSEKQIEKDIIDFIHRVGGYAVKVQSGKISVKNDQGIPIRWIHMAPEGTPDVLSCINGRFCAWEIKADKKAIEKWSKLKSPTSQAQDRTLAYISERGGISAVVCSVQEVQDLLLKHKLIGNKFLIC